MVKSQLKNVEKYLLLNTQLFPREWKPIALSLQLQRVPESWEHPNCRPSIHTLQSWIKGMWFAVEICFKDAIKKNFEFFFKAQNIRFEQLNQYYENNFKDIKRVNVSILKEPCSLFRAIHVESCLKNKLNSEEVKEKKKKKL